MGGTWDATNVLDAPVAVVTPVSLDHTELLGTDLAGDRRREGRDHQRRRGARARRAAGRGGRGAAAPRGRGRGDASLREGLEFGVVDRRPPSAGSWSRCRASAGCTRTCSCRCTAPTRRRTRPARSPRSRPSSAAASELLDVGRGARRASPTSARRAGSRWCGAARRSCSTPRTTRPGPPPPPARSRTEFTFDRAGRRWSAVLADKDARGHPRGARAGRLPRSSSPRRSPRAAGRSTSWPRRRWRSSARPGCTWPPASTTRWTPRSRSPRRPTHGGRRGPGHRLGGHRGRGAHPAPPALTRAGGGPVPAPGPPATAVVPALAVPAPGPYRHRALYRHDTARTHTATIMDLRRSAGCRPQKVHDRCGERHDRRYGGRRPLPWRRPSVLSVSRPVRPAVRDTAPRRRPPSSDPPVPTSRAPTHAPTHRTERPPETPCPNAPSSSSSPTPSTAGWPARSSRRLERKGLTLVAMELRTLDRATAEQHYAEHDGKPFFAEPGRRSSPAARWSRWWSRAPRRSRWSARIMGATDPVEAAPGTIRGDYALEIGENLVHGSDSPRVGRP